MQELTTFDVRGSKSGLKQLAKFFLFLLFQKFGVSSKYFQIPRKCCLLLRIMCSTMWRRVLFSYWCLCFTLTKLKVNALCSSETSSIFYQHYVPRDATFHSQSGGTTWKPTYLAQAIVPSCAISFLTQLGVQTVCLPTQPVQSPLLLWSLNNGLGGA
jgi:hypothetical protein